MPHCGRPLSRLPGMFALTMLAALGPALRASRLSAVQAMTAGRAPRTGRGYMAHRIAARLPLPRPVCIGLAAPFTRPSRSVVTLAAIAFGATAVMFAVGLTWALGRVQQSQTLSNTAPVQLQLIDPHTVPSVAEDAAVTAALRVQPGTERYVAVYGSGTGAGIEVPGTSQSLTANVFGGDASWLGYSMIAGRWYHAPGEVDVNTMFLTDSGLAIGDTTTVNLLGTTNSTIPIKIVGEVFVPSNNPSLYASAETMPSVATPKNLQEYDIGLRPGTIPGAYIRDVNNILGSHSPWIAATPQGNQFYGIATSLIALLGGQLHRDAEPALGADLRSHLTSS
jgi:putative ABC transport system permease protein